MVRSTHDSNVTAALWIWFALGVLAFACVPALRMRDSLWGWLPFWLLVAPLIDLALLHRRRLLATSQAFLVRHLRPRRSSIRQARRLHTRRGFFSRHSRESGNPATFLLLLRY